MLWDVGVMCCGMLVWVLWDAGVLCDAGVVCCGMWIVCDGRCV